MDFHVCSNTTTVRHGELTCVKTHPCTVVGRQVFKSSGFLRFEGYFSHAGETVALGIVAFDTSRTVFSNCSVGSEAMGSSMGIYVSPRQVQILQGGSMLAVMPHWCGDMVKISVEVSQGEVAFTVNDNPIPMPCGHMCIDNCVRVGISLCYEEQTCHWFPAEENEFGSQVTFSETPNLAILDDGQVITCLESGKSTTVQNAPLEGQISLKVHGDGLFAVGFVSEEIEAELRNNYLVGEAELPSSWGLWITFDGEVALVKNDIIKFDGVCTAGSTIEVEIGFRAGKYWFKLNGNHLRSTYLEELTLHCPSALAVSLTKTGQVLEMRLAD